MIVWTDAHLSPTIARWLTERFGVSASPLRDLGLRDADDPTIFAEARAGGVVLKTKDSDFIELVTRQGPPPQIVWVTCGNTSHAALRDLLEAAGPRVVALLEAGEPLVASSDAA